MPQISTAGYGLPKRATKRQVTLSGADIAALTQPTREIGAIGGAVASLGFKLADQTLEADARREFANFKGFIREQDNALEKLAAENDDFNLYGPAAQQGFKNIEKFWSGLSRRGQADAKNYWASVKPLYVKRVRDLIVAGMKDKMSADGFANIAKIIAAKDFTAEAAITTNEMRNVTGTKAATVDETDAKLLAIQKIANANVKANAWSHEQRQSIMAGAMDEIQMDAIYQSQVGLPYDEQRQNVNSMDGLTPAQRSGILTRLANDETIRQERLEVAQEADRRNLYAKILSNTYTPADAAATSLDVDDRHKFDTWNEQRIDRLNKGEIVVTNKTAFSRLKDLAVAIDDDRASRQVAQDALQEASAQGLINDDDWEIVDNMIRTKYTAARKSAEANARFVGIKQIVGVEVDSSLTMREAVVREIDKLRGLAQTESEKIRWSLYDDYMEDMREWFEEPKNKDKVKESYQVTKSKAQLYKALSDQPDELIREALGQTGPDKRISDILAGEPVKDGIPTVTTQAEYDALPKGAEFIDSEDGKRYRK